MALYRFSHRESRWRRIHPSEIHFQRATQRIHSDHHWSKIRRSNQPPSACALLIIVIQSQGLQSAGVPMSRFLASCFAFVAFATMLQAADDAKSTVAKLNETWLSAYKAADFDRLAALYAEDAVLMPTFSEPVLGRKAIRNFFAESVKDVPKRSMAL